MSPMLLLVLGRREGARGGECQGVDALGLRFSGRNGLQQGRLRVERQAFYHIIMRLAKRRRVEREGEGNLTLVHIELIRDFAFGPV